MSAVPVDNEIPKHILSDARRVVNELQSKNADIRLIRLPILENKDLVMFFQLHPHLTPTLFGYRVDFGVIGTVDIVTARVADGLNRTFNQTGRQTDHWMPPT